MRRHTGLLLALSLGCIEPTTIPPLAADRLLEEPTVTVLGEAFPPMETIEPETLPEPSRTLYADANAVPGGTGTAEAPFEDLQVALRLLEAGDRLVLRPGSYPGHLVVDDLCRNGTDQAPIQILGEDGATLVPASGGSGPLLKVQRSNWAFHNLSFDGQHKVKYPLHVIGAAANLPSRNIHLVGLTLSRGNKAGLLVGPDVDGFWLLNSEVKEGQSEDQQAAHGILIQASVANASFGGLRIHDNGGDGIHVTNHRDGLSGLEAREREAQDKLRIYSSRIYDNGGDGIELRDGESVELQSNRVWNHLKKEDSACVKIQGEVTDCTIRTNHLAECTRALWVGQGVHESEDEALIPDDVLVLRNYMSGILTANTSGVVLTTVKDLRLYHNIISEYDRGLTIQGFEFENVGVRIRNNLFHEHEQAAFDFTIWDNVESFDFNAFSLGGNAVMGRINNEESRTLDLFNEGLLPDSIIAEAVSFSGADLGEASGINLVDRGVPIPGLPGGKLPQGAAPDIGIAER